MNIFQAMMAAQGAVVFKVSMFDSDTGRRWTYQRTNTFTNFRQYPPCTLGFHFHETTTGEPTKDVNPGVPLNELRFSAIETLSDFYQKLDARAGHPTWHATMEPEVWVIEFVRKSGMSNEFVFYDYDTAMTAKRTLEYAAQSCGNLAKQ